MKVAILHQLCMITTIGRYLKVLIVSLKPKHFPAKMQSLQKASICIIILSFSIMSPHRHCLAEGLSTQ